jgi:hypothetical protein
LFLARDRIPDPQNPSRNSLINFHDESTLSLGPVPMLLFGIGAVGVFIFYRRRKMAHSARAELLTVEKSPYCSLTLQTGF